MTTTVINLHGLRDHPDHDPALNPAVVYVSRRQWWGPGRLLDEHPLKNPHLVDKPCRARGCHGIVHTRVEAIAAYGRRLLAHPDLLALVPELRGRTLGCWCAPELCHGHIVAALAGVPELEMRAVLRGLVADPLSALPAGVGLIVSGRPSASTCFGSRTAG
jgi:hypothetical protein